MLLQLGKHEWRLQGPSKLPAGQEGRSGPLCADTAELGTIATTTLPDNLTRDHSRSARMERMYDYESSDCTRPSASSRVSCSHIRTTLQPADSRASLARTSRSMLRRSLGVQYHSFVVGWRPC